jgi:hypothetical protein
MKRLKLSGFRPVLIHSAGIGCLVFVFAAGPGKSTGAPPGSVPAGAPAPVADIDIDGPDKIPAGQLAMFPLTGMTLADLTADPPKINLICVPEPLGVFYGVYDFLGRRPAALLQSNKSGTFTIILVDYEGRETKKKEVRVEGGPGPDPGPGPNPNPDPEPEGWALWTKQNAERLIDNSNRQKEAEAMSRAINACLSAQAAGVYKTPASLRAGVKAANVKAFVDLYGSQSTGRLRALDWEMKLNRALEDNIRKQIPNLDRIPLAEWVRLYGQIAEGLSLVR